MAALARLAARLRAWLNGRRLDEDFAAELDAHVAMLTETYERRGLPPDEARRAARLRVGAATSLQQAHRDARGLPGVDALVQDGRFALRLLARAPWFSAAAVTAIALGLGANAVGFTIVNAAFVRGFGFDGNDRLLGLAWRSDTGRRRPVSAVEFDEWRESVRAFAGLAGYRRAAVNVSDDRAVPEETAGAWVTANHFDLLRVAPVAGRGFRPSDEGTGAEPVALISDDLWQSRFQRDPGTIGAVLRVDGRPRTIVGVMPPGMKFPEDAEVWMPYAPSLEPRTRTDRSLLVFGRLADGATPAQADAEMQALAGRTRAAHPDAMAGLSGVLVETFVQRYLGGAARPMFVAVMGAVLILLLLAGVNVANLLLSRSAHRAREIAMRMSMGATRGRIVRQLLVESVLLAGLGGVCGLALAAGAVRAFDAAVRQTGAPYWLRFTIDARVLAYVAAVSVLTGIAFGLAPALRASSANAIDVLKDGGRGALGGRRAQRVGKTLVVAQLALALVLLSGGGLMIRSFLTLAAVDPGMPIEGLMRMRLQLPPATYPTAETRRAFFDRVAPRLAAIPGIAGVAVTTGVPPLAGESRRVQADPAPDAEPVWVSTVTVSPEYFGVVGVPVARGRDFTPHDGAAGARSAIVNASFAARFFPGEDPLGRRIRFVRRDDDDGNQAPDPAWRTIVGVSGAVLQGPPSDAFRADVVYLPFRDEAPRASSLLLRAAIPPAAVMDAVRREVQAVDRDQPVFSVQTVDEILAGERSIYRIFTVLFGLLAAVALGLSSLGLYAVMANGVARRTPEIGVRIAMGADRRQVSWLVLKEGLAQLAVGLALGLPAALALARAARVRLVEVEPTDPVTLAAVSGLLTAVAVAACLVPARRAARVEPTEALRAD
ncbi:MAG: ADOP family duplicated permease [Vicinamibacterales bacterium]